MINFVEGLISFDFPNGFVVDKLDGTDFYSKHFKTLQLMKSVDFVAFNPDTAELWLLEVTDYRSSTDNPIDGVNEMPQKVVSSLACLMAMRANSELEKELKFAEDAIVRIRLKENQSKIKLRVVLHLEQSELPLSQSSMSKKRSPRFSRDPKIYHDLLKKKLRPIDPYPIFSTVAKPRGVPWKATFLESKVKSGT
jgi:hypothetical protein